jgi:chromosome partitioning protein
VDIARSERYLHCFRDILTPLLEQAPYDYVFIDCPPSLGILTCNALTAAHALLIPVQCEYLALEGLSLITRLVQQLNSSGANAALELDGIVMTMFDSRTNLAAQVLEEVKKHFGARAYHTCIPRSVRLSEAPSFGKPVIVYDTKCSGALAYRTLAREFIRRHQPAEPAGQAPKAPHERLPGRARQPRQQPPAPAVAIPAPLSPRERLRRAYGHEEMDRPAVYSRAGFPGDDPTYDELKAYLREYSEIKMGWNGGQWVAPDQFERRTEPFSDEFQRIITRLATPKGALESTYLASLKGQPGLPETYLIKNRADAEAYLSLPLPQIAGQSAPFFEAEKALGDSGIMDVGLGFNPAGFIAELTGSENFALLSVTDRDILHALCERHLQLMQNLVKQLLAQKIGPFFSMCGEEYLVPPLHGPADFNDFNLRYDKPILDLIHAAGGRMHIHCHGRIKAVFQGFLEMGADVLHPFEPPPMGDLTAAEAKALAGDKICLEGNLQIAAMYEQTPEQIRAQTEALIADAFADRKNLIVSPSASPYIRGAGRQCLAQYQAMIDAVRDWKP